MALHGEKHQDHHHAGLVTRIVHDVTAAYDWLSGPAMSDRERMEREVYESRHDKHLNVTL